jgi:tetratricopeptide (TPR) repeat protein
MCSAFLTELAAQPSLSFELKKPKKFENKKLGSEKTAEKKFTLPRRFVQNTVTHYNWHYNANNRLNEVVAKAKDAHVDDYSKLLSFYNYDLDNTAADSSNLDSVLYRSNAGILVHDLRNSWIDNLYMLMGRAYFYKKEFDSAYLTFQYINYAFSPKEKDGYDKPIGSNSTEGGTTFSISTKENNSIPTKIFTSPPSRNESFIWQIRTYIAKDELAEAAGLIETLKADPLFPDRLALDLHEVQAWWFYKKGLYDSAAVYLEKALNNAENKQEEARWEYLIAQLYERGGNAELAQQFYERCIKHTLDPVLEVYARLNAIRQNKSDSNAIQESINELLKMARKDRYTNFRDVIYYTAAQIELDRNNTEAAKSLLLKATQTSIPSSTYSQRTNAFLLLGNLSYKERNYRDAKRYYDSIVATDPVIEDPEAFEKRKNLLAGIVTQLEIVDTQDSLQRLAALPEAEREAYIKNLVKKLRREQGLRDEEPSTATTAPRVDNRPVSDLFDRTAKGEWYFYNPALKSKGYTEFRNKWGNRPNEDNWRRSSAINQAIAGNTNDGLRSSRTTGSMPSEIGYEALLKNVPLTPMQIDASNNMIQSATLEMSTAYLEGLEDYPTVIETLEKFLERYPATTNLSQALFQLYYSYTKTGDVAKAERILKMMQEKYPGSDYEKLATNAKNGVVNDPLKADMTARYDAIYSQFIEGRFEEALAHKKVADSLYSNNYWTPQLLYIESVYHIRQRQDSAAKLTLQKITELFPTSPMAGKAKTLIDVLNRRNEIENYLTNLQISRPIEDSTVIDTLSQERVTVTPPPSVVKAPQPNQQIVKPAEVVKDTVQAKPVQLLNTAYTFNAELPHAVVIVMDKVDPVYVSESRNAFNRYNKEKYYNKVIDINNEVLNDTTKLVIMTNFENAATALDYLEKTRKAAATEIVPWMPAGKYNFILISTSNLEILRTKKDLREYKKFLNQSFPRKFN